MKKVNASTAEKNAYLWHRAPGTILDLPPFLNNSIIFPLPYDVPKESTNIFITTKNPSTVYIGCNEKYGRKQNPNYGWSKKRLEEMGFEKETRGEIKINHPVYGTTSLNLFRRSLNEEELIFEFNVADTEESQIVLFVDEGNYYTVFHSENSMFSYQFIVTFIHILIIIIKL